MEWVVLGFMAVIVLIVAISMLRMLWLHRSQPAVTAAAPGGSRAMAVGRAMEAITAAATAATEARA